MLSKLHDFLAAHGISPKVADPVLLAVVGIVVNLIDTGHFPSDFTELKAAAIGVVLAIVGIAAPPAASGTKTRST